MEKCGFCPVTPEDFEKTPTNPIQTTQLVTFPCGHSFHTQCIFNRILQDKFCTMYGDIHIESILCTHCGSLPVPQESLAFYQNYYTVNRRILDRNYERHEQNKIASLYQENEEFRDSLFQYKKIKTEHNKCYKNYTKEVQKIKKEFHQNTKIAVEMIRFQKKQSIKKASELPHYKKVCITAGKLRKIENYLATFFDGAINRRAFNAALVKIDGAPKIVLKYTRWSPYYRPKFLFRLRVRI